MHGVVVSRSTVEWEASRHREPFGLPIDVHHTVDAHFLVGQANCHREATVEVEVFDGLHEGPLPPGEHLKKETSLVNGMLMSAEGLSTKGNEGD